MWDGSGQKIFKIKRDIEPASNAYFAMLHTL